LLKPWKPEAEFEIGARCIGAARAIEAWCPIICAVAVEAARRQGIYATKQDKFFRVHNVIGF
jgi:hypothetical protein